MSDTASHGTGAHKPSMLSNLLAIIGLIILIIIILWGLVHLVSLSSQWFSSLLQPSAPKVEVAAPQDVASGAPTTISWKYGAPDLGTYSFLYKCEKNVELAVITGVHTASPITCGSAVNLSSSTSTAVQVLPVLSGTTATAVPVSIIYTSKTGVQTTGDATMTIHPASSQATVTTTTTNTGSNPTKTTPAKTVTKTYISRGSIRSSLPADLSVRILAVGVIDPTTGLFVNRTPSMGDTVAVKFDIANIGGRPTGTWYFEANLPTATTYLYSSPAQMSLAPGAHIENTLRFTAPAAGGGTFTVAVNQNGMVSESNYGNDTASQFVPVANYYQPVYQY